MSTSDSDVKKIVSITTFKRGVEVIESGKLTEAYFRGSGLEEGEASCSGSRPGEVYHVSFSIPLAEGSIGLDKLIGKCTCPVRSKFGAPCKHVVALLLLRIQKLGEGEGGNDAKELETASIDDESTEPLEDDGVRGGELPAVDSTADVAVDAEVASRKGDQGMGKEGLERAETEVAEVAEAARKRRVLPSWITDTDEPQKKRSRQKEGSDCINVAKDEAEGRKAAQRGKQPVKQSDAANRKPVRKRRLGTVVESESSEEEGVAEAVMPWEEEGGEAESDLELEMGEPVRRRRRSKGGEGPSVQLRGGAKQAEEKERRRTNRKEGSSWDSDKNESEKEEVEAPMGKSEGKFEGSVKERRRGKQVAASSGDEDSDGANSLKVAYSSQKAHGAGADSRGNLEDEGHSDIPGRPFKAGAEYPDSEGFVDRNGYEGVEEVAAPASSFEWRSEAQTAGGEPEDKNMREEEDVEASGEGMADLKPAEGGGSLSEPIEGMGMDGRGGEGAALDYDDIFDIFITPVHKKIGKGSSVEPADPSDPKEGAMREASYAQKEEGDGRVESVVNDGVALPYSNNTAPPSSLGLENLPPVASAKKPKKKMRVACMLL